MRKSLPFALCVVLFACGGDDDGAMPDAGADGPRPDAAPDASTAMKCGDLMLNALPIRLDEPVMSSTEGSSTTEPSGQNACFGATGPEAVYFVEVTEQVDLIWEVMPVFDAVAYIRSDCDALDSEGNPLDDPACADGDFTGGTETAVWRSAQPGTYYLFVDGYEPSDAGDFTATVRARPLKGEGEACDPSGVADRCMDGLGCNPDSTTCTRELHCTDLTDNDQDGLVDCEDPDDCQTLAICAPGAGEVGSACDMPSDCAANATDPFCFEEVATGWPAGYCSEFCNLGADDCAAGSVCLDVRIPSGNGLCFRTCDTAADCPSLGYGCEDPGTGTKVCLPACTADAQCASAGFCNEDDGFCTATDETCDDGADNDGDQLVDCEDRDCATDATCAAAIAAACTAPPAAGVDTMGDTTGGTGIFAGSCTGRGGALERVFSFVPGLAGETGYIVVTLDSATDQGIYVRGTCADAGTELACRDDLVGGQTEGLSAPAGGGVPVTIFVDGFAPGEEGPFTLSAVFVETNETEPNDTFETANAFVDPFNAGIGVAGDQDFVSVTVPGPASAIEVEVQDLGSGECANRGIDSEVEIFDTDGTTSLAANDDISMLNWCSMTSATGLAAGTYFVRVSSSQAFNPAGTFGYRLAVTVTP